MTSIRGRLLVTMLLGLLVVLLIGGVALDAVVRRKLTDQFDEALLMQATTLSTAVVLDHGDLEFESAGSTNLPAYYRITLMDGQTFSGAGEVMAEGGLRRPTAAGQTVWQEVELPGDGDGMAVSLAVAPREEAQGAAEYDAPASRQQLVVVTVVEPMGELQRSIAIVQTSIVVTGLVVLALAGGVVWWGVRRALSPLDRLAAGLARIKSDTVEPVDRPGVLMSELSPVYDALDHLLARMRSALERERRFTDAAAHELRTPLAELRTIADVARRWPEPERLGNTVKQTGIIASRMQGLIEALLLLGRNPREIEAQSHEPVNIAGFTDEEVQRHLGAVQDKSIDLRLDVDPLSTWMLPEPVAALIVGNLVANAVEYTPQGGVIAVRLSGDTLTLTNGPVELTRAQMSLLFEPFWRSDASRSDATHHGLGLALVQHGCASCGLSCKAELNNQQLTFTISAEGDDAS